ncbi:FAD-dependent oxidoreductase [Roseibacterium sp. SDUM158017]|uniref:NAD(P)/FAD-dependent oxidoreductase n=1 Tax=Roseicyclus salinarum TaxID=3036773 RepID=UPI0024154D75|nr:FAD-dependent oxidoreductase [Roseibacterium sp. SDUM158017]MDG4650564.1 FAD-dependent oxidoreductase [Roseibacterium sp. SDUM158017]
MAGTADAIVIGAGVIGAAVAHELARDGRDVLCLDAKGAAGHGSTAGSCAIVRVHYSTLEGCAMAWEGFHDWAAWRDYLGAPQDEVLAEFRQTGCLVMKTEANGRLARHIEMSETLGCPYEEWTAARITERLPIYSLERFAPAKRMDDPAFGEPTGGTLSGGVFWPTAGYVTDPALSAQNIAAAARRAGARLRFNAEVAEILTQGGRVAGVRLADGDEIHAPVVVNVAGPASRRINEMAGVTGDMTIGTRPLRQEVVHVPAPEGFDFETDGIIVSDSDIACYCRPARGNNILIGSEDPACDPHDWVDDRDWNADFTDQWTTQALRYAQRVPTLGIPSRMRGVVELYDASSDWIPIYDRSCLPGFYMACGTSGNQYKNAPVAGRLMAALISYCEAGHDHDAQPLRFRLDRIGHEIDAGFFSRRREINAQSSFSVLG